MLALIRAALIGVAVGIICFGCFFAVNKASLGRADIASVGAAFARGDLQDSDYLYGDTRIGEHQFNDCLILGMAIDKRAPPDELDISPTHGFPAMNSGLCKDLRKITQEAGVPPRPLIFYHNYVHGQVTLTRFLLDPFGVAGLRAFYKALSILIVAFGFALSLWGLAIGRDVAFWAIFFAVFGCAFGLPSYAQSLSHAPADITFLLFALYMCAGTVRGGLSKSSLVFGAGIFGSLTAIFEMLTGGIPLGMALLSGGALFAVRDRQIGVVFESICAFVGGAIAVFAAKIVLVVEKFGVDRAGSLLREAGARMYGQPPSIEVPRDLGLGSWLSSVSSGMHSLMPGVPGLAQLTLVIAVVSGVWGLVRLLRTEERSRASFLAASNFVIIGWMIVFWQHTIVHARFMDRILAWTIASGLALFVFACRCSQQTDGTGFSTVE